VFSGLDRLVGFLPIVQRIIEAEDFQPAAEKTRITRSGSRQEVLGLNVNTRVSVPRRVRRLIRAMVHRPHFLAQPSASHPRDHAAHLLKSAVRARAR